MKHLFFTWVVLIAAGCAATNRPSVQILDTHPQSNASLSDAYADSTLVCTKLKVSTKTPWLGKINGNLLCAKVKAEMKGVSFAAMAAQMGIVTAKEGVVLDIVTNPFNTEADIKQKLQFPGVSIQFISAKYHRVSLIIHDSALLYQLAKLTDVRTIMPEYGAQTHGNNVTTGIHVEPKSYKRIHHGEQQ